MANVSVLFAGFDLNSASNNSLSKVFGGKSSVELALEWASKSGDKTFILSNKENNEILSKIISSSNLISSDKIEIVNSDSDLWTASKIASMIADCCKKSDVSTAVYAWIDLPFLNCELTSKLLEMHTECLAEYSFADGYPYGVSPEIIDVGTASIIAELSKEKELSATRTSLFDVMKCDINSFEIETLVSDTDYRTLRISLETSSKGGLISCKALFDSICEKNDSNLSVDLICEKAAKNPRVLRNIPHFFDIQITSKINHKTLYSPENANIGIENIGDMQLDNFKELVKKIAVINPDAVVSLSAFGEPLLHPQFLEFVASCASEKLRILIETDGLGVTEEIAEKIKTLSENTQIDWIIDVDAADFEFYSKIRAGSEADFNKALASVSILEDRFPNRVYPQMTRLIENEENLEKFFRFWKNPESPSKGKLIIKKFDSLCGKLPDKKSADLSPLVRIPCWHLCRDFVVLSDGSVPKCRSCGKSEVRGNAFTESLADLWEAGFKDYSSHVEAQYKENCGGCDEFYTFSF